MCRSGDPSHPEKTTFSSCIVGRRDQPFQRSCLGSGNALFGMAAAGRAPSGSTRFPSAGCGAFGRLSNCVGCTEGRSSWAGLIDLCRPFCLLSRSGDVTIAGGGGEGGNGSTLRRIEAMAGPPAFSCRPPLDRNCNAARTVAEVTAPSANCQHTTGHGAVNAMTT